MGVIVVSLLFLSITSIPGYSQFQLNKEWGAVVGVNFSIYSGLRHASPSIRPSLGIFATIPVSERLSVDPLIFFFYGAGASKFDATPPPQYPAVNVDTTNVRRMSNYFSLAVPVRYHFPGSFISVGLGPQVMILTGSGDEFLSTNGNDHLRVDSKYAMHQYDAGVVGSITRQKNAMLKRNLIISLTYYQGLMYAIKQNDSQAKNSILQISVAIPFSKRPLYELKN